VGAFLHIKTSINSAIVEKSQNDVAAFHRPVHWPKYILGLSHQNNSDHHITADGIRVVTNLDSVFSQDNMGVSCFATPNMVK
jgi:hypothetical protein